MTAAVAWPEPGPDPGPDPESPYESRRARIVIMAVVGGLSLFLGLFSAHSLLNGLDGYPWGLRVADIVCGLAGYVALWWRRRWPLAFAGYILLISVFSTLSGGLAFVAAFTVAVHRHWPTALVTSALLAAAAWPGLLLYRDSSMRDTEVIFVFVVIMMFAVTGWGMFIRARRQLLASLRRRAERAERTREEHAQHARIAERQRIAREMHDVLAHRLSLLSLQAGALEVTPVSAGAAATEAAAAIRATTHQALQELRSIVWVLRDDDEPGTAPPQPVAADLPALITEASATASIHADWGGVELAEVPADTGRTLYRIVQEGLTNARKHAPGSAVEVTVDGTPDRGLDVAVTSWLPLNPPAANGDAVSGAHGDQEVGTGLIGLRERAVLAGGHLDAAVTGDRRFRLSGWLPWAGR
jgi:signal transduction histidine kinase